MKSKVKSKQTCKWQDINNSKQVIKDYIEEIQSEAYYIKWLFQRAYYYNFNQQLINNFENLYNENKN
jgi:hypothetical protein